MATPDSTIGEPSFGGMSRRNFLEKLSMLGGTALMTVGMDALGFSTASAAVAPPMLTGGGKGKSVIVIGTGVAGMTSAYELSEAGYNVTLLEGRNRVGGRSFTARHGTVQTEVGGETITCDFDDDPKMYINGGPWRIPYWHRGYLHYAKKFAMPVELFNNDNDHSYIDFEKGKGPLGGKPVRKREIAADMRGYADEMLAKQVRQGALDSEFTPGDKELFLDYLRSEGYLTRNDYKYLGAEGRTPDVYPGAGLDPGPGKESTPYKLTDILKSNTWQVLKSVTALDMQRTMFEPVNGMEQLPLHFRKNLKVQVRLEHNVKKISQTPTSVTVHFLDGAGKEGTVTADYCVCTIPLPVLRTVELDVPAKFKEAMGGVSYALVGKCGLQMKTRFWEDNHHIYGGHIYTDDPMISTISVPSSNWLGQKGVLLGFYPHGAAAARISAMSQADRRKYALAGGQKYFPEYTASNDGFFSICWHRVPFNMGGWAEWTAEGRAKYYPTLLEPQGRLVLAGEHLSYLTGWQEGGIESAWQQIAKVHKMAMA
jgi:monoamine oxidase